jgi:hypothetical protein
MDGLTTPPKWLTDQLPEGARTFLQEGGWLGILALLGLLLLFILWKAAGGLFRGKRPTKVRRDKGLREDLATIPAAPPHSGDRKLTVEGVPVRLRLVIVAPAGTAYEVKPDAIPDVLDRVLPGLGDVWERDRPQTRVWPHQLSSEGFANTFHRSTPAPEGQGRPSRWVLVAGRADLGGRQVLIGLGLQAIKPTTVGRKTLKPHEWATVLRVRVLEP